MLGCGPLPITVHIRKLTWNPKKIGWFANVSPLFTAHFQVKHLSFRVKKAERVRFTHDVRGRVFFLGEYPTFPRKLSRNFDVWLHSTSHVVHKPDTQNAMLQKAKVWFLKLRLTDDHIFRFVIARYDLNHCDFCVCNLFVWSPLAMILTTQLVASSSAKSQG